MAPTTATARSAFADRVASSAAATAGPAAPPGIEDFTRLCLAGIAPEDLAERGEDYLAGAMVNHWELAGERPAATALVRVYAPVVSHPGAESMHTVVEIVTDDMPFIVDSVTMEIARHGLGVHLVIHPIVRVRRDAAGRLLAIADDAESPADGNGVVVESFVRVEVDRETDVEVLDALRDDLQRILRDVRAATGDWLKMLAALRRVIDGLNRNPPPVDPDELSEGRALLEWMGDHHFSFLGCREYALDVVDGEDVLRAVPGTGLGILRERPGVPTSGGFARLSPEGRRQARERRLLVLTKANSRSTVHRPSYLDYVGVKKFGADGEVVGEYRFLGLYSSAAYNTSPIDIPLLRHKVTAVLERAGFSQASHSQKDLIAILETYPRDDLFQISVDDLFDVAMGILQLQERRRVRVFARRDSWGRFVSCLVFVPRDRYTTALRLRVAEILGEAFGATGHEFNARVSESVLARLHYVLHLAPGAPTDVDIRTLEAMVAQAARSWSDGLRDALVAARGEEDGITLARRYGDAFPASYRDDFSPANAVADVTRIEHLLTNPEAGPSVRLSRAAEGREATLDFTIFGADAPLPLSGVMPLLQNMGVSVLDEHPYVVGAVGAPPIWIERFGLRAEVDGALAAETVRETFQDAFAAMLHGDAENDGFQRLVLAAGLTWRQVSVLRAYSRYLRQTGTLFSQPYIADALVAQPHIARILVDIFVARFDPSRQSVAAEECARLAEEAEVALDAVASLDEDRILRSLLALVLATTRTTYFQSADNPRDHLAFKLDPAKVPDLPAPRPMFEIFVYSPRVEGVHLRAGKVARGGIRWSDRREDFRTEVLGLMKAQMVKNAVIVPVGAKGGFVVKQAPADREALAAEVVACYRIFISALLDLTDNLVGNRVVPPAGVVRYDADDPYLVVAADKGTATFSDVANEIAVSRGFWLGDAFASGGSVGYDHKKMAITARGAWESVKRHFRQLGIDTQTTDFTTVGIGDMSGDVFGNGMLLSRHIRLVAAFDHRHVFLDPEPDPESSFRERERLFALPRSSWDDYDRSLVSEGGGVFPRSAKSIPLAPKVRERLAVDAAALTPAELIRAILLAPVDLLWNGGIGTYVKASEERNADVGDKTNDPVRVDGRDLRCRVVGEGGNLGLTQKGRVEFALSGGFINTDAIDNSAGVDCSDHEVNIKILLDAAVEDGELGRDERNPLLVEMTGEVAELVLRDNYRQNRALANARSQATSMEDVHARYLRALEHQGRLDRRLEFLPDDETLTERRHAGIGLTTPELAVLLAYTKIAFESEILDSDVPDDPDFDAELVRYFPSPLRDRFAGRIRAHPLRREIVATSLVNGVVNRAGTSFVFRLGEETGAPASEIARAHTVAWEVLDQQRLWHDVDALDGSVAADAQTFMYLESRKLVERATRWLLRHRRRPLPVATTIEVFRDGVRRLSSLLPDLLLGNERSWLESCSADLESQGVPAALAHRVAGLESLFAAFDIVDVAAWAARGVDEVAPVYCIVGERLHLDWLRDRIVDLPRGDRWESLARIALRDDAYNGHRAIAADVLTCSPPGADHETAFGTWAARNSAAVARAGQVIGDVRSHAVFDMSTLSVALREIRNLVQAEG